MGMKRLEILGLSFRRSPRGAPILTDIDLEVAAGDILSILGPNGAGKSTLVQCLLGLLHPETGSVRLSGDDVARLTRLEIARRIAYVPQSAQTAFSFEAAHMVLTGRSVHIGGMGAPSQKDRQIAEDSMRSVGILHLRRRLFTELSGGERQLVLIARAIAQETPVIVMDEPTASLDLGNQGRALGLIRELARAGKSVIITTHLPDQAFNLRCRVALMKKGRLTAVGPVEDVCGTESMNELYGARLRRLTDGAAGRLSAFVPELP
jgi:iron complex transport system ATP-binding protein